MVKDSLRKQHIDDYEVLLKGSDCSVAVQNKSSRDVVKLARFSDKRERWAWTEIERITQLSKDGVIEALLDLDAQP
eukprot:1018423-Amphidinium_carterae.1